MMTTLLAVFILPTNSAGKDATLVTPDEMVAGELIAENLTSKNLSNVILYASDVPATLLVIVFHSDVPQSILYGYKKS